MRSAIAGSVSRPPKRRSNIVSPRAWASSSSCHRSFDRPCRSDDGTSSGTSHGQDHPQDGWEHRASRTGSRRWRDRVGFRLVDRPNGADAGAGSAHAGDDTVDSRPRVVIVMPAYNAAQTLERTYADIPHEIV